MPLKPGCGKASENISEMVHSGHPQRQAVAAALREQRETCPSYARKHPPPKGTVSYEREHPHKSFYLKNSVGKKTLHHQYASVRLEGFHFDLEEIEPGFIRVLYVEPHHSHHLGTVLNMYGHVQWECSETATSQHCARLMEKIASRISFPKG